MTTDDLNKKGHGEKQSRKEDEVILALLTEPTLERAAKKCRIAVKTLWRWLQQPEFQARYREARRVLFKEALLHLQQCSEKAVWALTRNLQCAVPSVEVKAALGILEHAIKASHLYELQDRVSELEASLKNRSAQQ
jgi:hypothetical protein